MLKVGLVGIGYLGSRHLRHLLDLDGVSVARIWDSDPEVLTRAAAEYGVKPAAGMDDLLHSVDAVDLVTPTSTHYELGIQAVAGGKPLFIEKPICATAAAGERLVTAARTAGVPVQVGHIERFNRAFRALEGVKVKPRFIEAHRLAQWNPRGADVDVIHDLMVHDLDLILALSEGELRHLHANGVGVITDSVDIANARLEFSTGLVANVTASRISLKRMRKLRLFGEREYIALDLDKGSCEYVSALPGGTPLPQGAVPLGGIDHGGRKLQLFQRFLETPEADALRAELAEFRDIAAGKGLPTVSGEAALAALRLAERIVAEIRGE